MAASGGRRNDGPVATGESRGPASSPVEAGIQRDHRGWRRLTAGRGIWREHVPGQALDPDGAGHLAKPNAELVGMTASVDHDSGVVGGACAGTVQPQYFQRSPAMADAHGLEVGGTVSRHRRRGLSTGLMVLVLA